MHAGIYSALARGYDRRNGLRLRVVVPGATTDSIKLLEAGRVDFAVLDIHDLAIARQAGKDLVGIMALVERPLSAVVAAPSVRTPRQLQGRLVGITGVPSDTAVLRSVVAGAGGDPSRVRTITIGFNAVPDLLAGRVAAATAFWNDEGVTLATKRPGFHSFRVESYGAPSYPELVVSTTASALRRDPAVGARAGADAHARATRSRSPTRLRAPATSSGSSPASIPSSSAAQLDALLPAFRGPNGRIGELDPAILRRWAAWEARFGIVKRPPDVAALFDAGFQ